MPNKCHRMILKCKYHCSFFKLSICSLLKKHSQEKFQPVKQKQPIFSTKFMSTSMYTQKPESLSHVTANFPAALK